MENEGKQFDFLTRRQVAAGIGQVRFAIRAAGGSEADVRAHLLPAAARCDAPDAEQFEPGMTSYRGNGEG